MTQKMIQHTEYDRKTGKYIRTMIPQSKEHKVRTQSINKALSKFKEPKEKEKRDYQNKIGRAWND